MEELVYSLYLYITRLLLQERKEINMVTCQKDSDSSSAHFVSFINILLLKMGLAT